VPPRPRCHSVSLTHGGSEEAPRLLATVVLLGYKTRSIQQLASFRLAKKHFTIQWIAQSHLHPDVQVDQLPDNPAECNSGIEGGVHVCVMKLTEA
jgi:hypothetical protein